MPPREEGYSCCGRLAFFAVVSLPGHRRAANEKEEEEETLAQCVPEAGDR